VSRNAGALLFTTKKILVGLRWPGFFLVVWRKMAAFLSLTRLPNQSHNFLTAIPFRLCGKTATFAQFSTKT
jgi:hypothetical protein